jgi:hypothetical protein
MTLSTLLRRGFVLLAAMAAVAVTAVAVDRVRGDTHEGESVLVVPAGSGSAEGPGAVDQAGRLASTYEGVVPEDRQVIRRAAEAAGVGTRQAERGLAATQRGRTAILELSFTAPTRKRAIRGVKAAAESISGPSPVTEAVAPRSLKTIRAPRTKSGIGGHIATMLLSVPTGAGTTGPGNADQANKLAVTYAAALPDDDGELGHTYKDGDEAQAKRGIEAVTEAVSGDEPVARSIPPRGLEVVRAPAVAGAAGLSTTGLIIAGALLGLALGVVLLIALERAQPRVRDPRTLAAATGAPVSRLDDLGPASAASLLERWRELGNGRGGTVALVPADQRSERATKELASALAQTGRASGIDVDVRGLYGSNGNGHGGPAPAVKIVTAGPGAVGAAEAHHAGPGVAVIVARDGTRCEAVRDVSLRLGDFGMSPGWALLVNGRRSTGSLDEI